MWSYKYMNYTWQWNMIENYTTFSANNNYNVSLYAASSLILRGVNYYAGNYTYNNAQTSTVFIDPAVHKFLTTSQATQTGYHYFGPMSFKTTATSYLTRSSTSATIYLTRSSTSGYSGVSSSSSESSGWE